MDTMSAFNRAQRASREGARERMFDWNRAAQMIVNEKAQSASAGLGEDWEWTGGIILKDGKPVPKNRTYVYLASIWAIPEIEINGTTEQCWVYVDEAPSKWLQDCAPCDVYWPDSALKILENGISRPIV